MIIQIKIELLMKRKSIYVVTYIFIEKHYNIIFLAMFHRENEIQNY